MTMKSFYCIRNDNSFIMYLKHDGLFLTTTIFIRIVQYEMRKMVLVNLSLWLVVVVIVLLFLLFLLLLLLLSLYFICYQTLVLISSITQRPSDVHKIQMTLYGRQDNFLYEKTKNQTYTTFFQRPSDVHNKQLFGLKYFLPHCQGCLRAMHQLLTPLQTILDICKKNDLTL